MWSKEVRYFISATPVLHNNETVCEECDVCMIEGEIVNDCYLFNWKHRDQSPRN